MHKKYLAELIGAAMLVFVGCGTAMIVGCDAVSGSGYLLTALAFGLVIVALAYSIGNISGCHVNPAVSLAMWISKKMNAKEMAWYMIAQFMGALTGACMLGVVFGLTGIYDKTANAVTNTPGFAANSLTAINGSVIGGILIEAILTFIFIFVILGVSSEKNENKNMNGLIIGLTLALVHIVGIGLTGTSVNPARSFGAAVAAAIVRNAEPLKVLPVFIIGPAIGAVLAAFAWKAMEKDETEEILEKAKEIEIQKYAAMVNKALEEMAEEELEDEILEDEIEDIGLDEAFDEMPEEEGDEKDCNEADEDEEGNIVKK